MPPDMPQMLSCQYAQISEECFQHLVESMPQRIKAVLKAKGVQPGTSKVYLIKWPVRDTNVRIMYYFSTYYWDRKRTDDLK